MDKFWQKIYRAHKDCTTCPSPAEVAVFFTELLGLLFPDYSQLSFATESDFEKHVLKLRNELNRILQYQPNRAKAGEEALTSKFFDTVPRIHEKINEDVQAMFDGDPAAKSKSEIIRTYPGFYAIAAYRVAHELHKLGITDIPRIITELAHSKTGIDIHPAAVIGRYFCIDHGTGIVVGETTVIGDYVKVYQGVTLGALSVSKEDAEKKRHPTLQDYVVVYAGATILGGDTTIGHHTVIGGNVWLTRSVPPYSKIYYQSKMYDGNKDQTDVVIFRAEND
jgi:serine O-acetyltransferase